MTSSFQLIDRLWANGNDARLWWAGTRCTDISCLKCLLNNRTGSQTAEVFVGQTRRVGMAGTGEGKKEEADYKRLHSFPLIRHTDMPEEMRVETMELCVTACEKFATNNESAAKMIKESMDKKFGSSWHVVIGEGFGFEVTHEVKNLLYMFFGGSLAVCVWKCS
uniref:Dynein light chain n=1 Tax=Stegastes partitus TaxID=144197 RepID=A0A3B5B7S5_9TELE